MKIHYTSGHFFIEQDGKKIKIANQNEAEDACWRSDNRINNHISLYNWKRLVLKEGDYFDLPKELSVEIKNYTCNHHKKVNEIECPDRFVYSPDCCGAKESVAILSKSSSPEDILHDFAKKVAENQKDIEPEFQRVINERFWDMLGPGSSPEIPDSSEPDLKESIEILKRHNQWRRGGDGDMTHPKRLGQAIDTVIRHLESPPTVAGASTEVNKMESEIITLLQAQGTQKAYCQSLEDQIEERDKTISDLRERVKELEVFIKEIDRSLYIGEDLKDKEVLDHYVQVVSVIKEQIKEI